MQAQGLEEEGVQEGEGVEGSGAGEGGAGGRVGESGREGEQLGAQGGLEAWALRELVHQVRERDAGRLVAGG